MSATAGKWTAADISDQTGKTVLVTGANSGLGLQTAKALAGAGATVLMACRNAEKAADARASKAALLLTVICPVLASMANAEPVFPAVMK